MKTKKPKAAKYPVWITVSVRMMSFTTVIDRMMTPARKMADPSLLFYKARIRT
jgi:hypothetical protein